VAELFEFNEQVMRRWHVGDNTQPAAALVGELSVLVEHQHAFDFGTGDEEELLVLVGRKFLEALVQEQRADSIPAGTMRGLCILVRDLLQAAQKIVGPLNLDTQASSLPSMTCRFIEPGNQFFAPLDQRLSFFFKMCGFHCSYASVISLSMVMIPELTSFGCLPM
jgi:hypothetical protein